jgi:hypothetical protein
MFRRARRLQAAQQAFGDMKDLDRNLHGYVGRSRISVIKVAAQALPISVVTVEPLSAGAGEVLPLRRRMKIGVPDAEAPASPSKFAPWLPNIRPTPWSR